MSGCLSVTRTLLNITATIVRVNKTPRSANGPRATQTSDGTNKTPFSSTDLSRSAIRADLDEKRRFLVQVECYNVAPRAFHSFLRHIGRGLGAGIKDAADARTENKAPRGAHVTKTRRVHRKRNFVLCHGVTGCI